MMIISLPGGLPDFDNEEDSCTMWRRFANLWETSQVGFHCAANISQSLFWASFGLVDLGDFDLKGIGGFTRYTCIHVICKKNRTFISLQVCWSADVWQLLCLQHHCAPQHVDCHDVQLLPGGHPRPSQCCRSLPTDQTWSGSSPAPRCPHLTPPRMVNSQLWISYFNSGATVPPPFNMMPSPKALMKVLMCR